MGPAVVQYRFESLPSAFRYFPRAVFGRRSALVPDGQTVPRLEARVDTVRANRRHLVRYRQVCGFADDGCLPLTYPHVLAMPIQFAILTHPRFPVRLMGLVHLANDIHQARSLPESGRFELRSWIEGHRDVDRGHEFDLFTSVEDGQGTAWLEKSTLLARRSSGARRASRGARQALRYETPPDGSQPEAADITVPRAMGRRYGWLSGDLNPIHLGDRGARLFGFERAVAHGMWSMARSFAALGPVALAPPVQAQVEFKFPLFMPGQTRLEHWTCGDRHVFVLKDSASGRPHVAGSTRPG
jgi:acyl dehydratase